jgi:hypothetical protein
VAIPIEEVGQGQQQRLRCGEAQNSAMS